MKYECIEPWIFGFDLMNRMVLRDNRTGRIYR